MQILKNPDFMRFTVFVRIITYGHNKSADKAKFSTASDLSSSGEMDSPCGNCAERNLTPHSRREVVARCIFLGFGVPLCSTFAPTFFYNRSANAACFFFLPHKFCVFQSRYTIKKYFPQPHPNSRITYRRFCANK